MSAARPDDPAFAPTRPAPVGLPPGEPDDTNTLAPPAGYEPAPESVRIPGYDVQGVLGRGGMGIVYKARQTALNRIVALKMVLSGGRIESTERHRFLVEADAMAAIRHPNVVNVYAYGDDDGRPYLVLEYLPGGTLATRIRQGERMPPAEAAALVEKVARGVHAAHAVGIVHRDLKSANVLFDATGEPKVTDFGLAKRTGSSDVTRTGAVMGTPAYMAPEQAKGEFKFVGPAADVWALGVIFYECLTGTVPFRGDDAWGVLAQVMADEPMPPRKIAADVPRDLNVICLKCLSKAPLDRYPTAEALADDLTRFRAGEPIRARPVSGVERVLRWARRKPAHAGLTVAAGLLLAIAAVAAGMWSLWREADTQHVRAMTFLGEKTEEQNRTASALARETHAVLAAKVANEKLEHVSAINRVVLAHRDWQAGDVASASKELEAVPQQHREWEWHYVHKLCHGENRVIRFGDGDCPKSLTVSPDGKLAAVGVEMTRVIVPGDPPSVIGSEIRIVELDTENITTFSVPILPPELVFDPTGRWIASAHIGRPIAPISIWDWAKRKKVVTTPATLDAVGCEFDPTVPGRYYIFSEAGPVTTWRIVEGRPPEKEPTGILPNGIGENRSPLTRFSIARNGKRAVATTAGAIFSWTPSDPTSVVRAEIDDGIIRPSTGNRSIRSRIEISPDGTHAAFGRADGTIALVQTADLAPVPRSPTDGIAVARYWFDPSGRLTAANIVDSTVHFRDLDSGRSNPVLRHKSTVTGVGGRALTGEIITTTSDGTLRVWPSSGTVESRNVRLSRPTRPGGDGVAGLVNPSWTADLSLMGYWDTSDWAYRVWDTSTGRARFSPAEWNTVTRPSGFGAVETRYPFSINGRNLLHSDGTIVVPVVAKSAPSGRVVRVFHFRLTGAGSADTVRDIPLPDPFALTPVLSADGTCLAIETYRSKPTGSMNKPPPDDEQSVVRVFDVRTGKERFSTSRLDRWVSLIHLTPDGRRLVVFFLDQTVRAWQVDTGAPAFPTWENADRPGQTGTPIDAHKLTISPDGTYLAFATGNQAVQRIHVRNLETGQELSWPAIHFGTIEGFAFRPDGKRLLSFGSDRRVKLWDVTTGTTTLTLLQPEPCTAAMFSADGTKILLRRDVGNDSAVLTFYETERSGK